MLSLHRWWRLPESNRRRASYRGTQCLHMCPAGIPAGAPCRMGEPLLTGCGLYIEERNSAAHPRCWRARPDSNRLPPVVLQVCFQKSRPYHLPGSSPRAGSLISIPVAWECQSLYTTIGSLVSLARMIMV